MSQGGCVVKIIAGGLLEGVLVVGTGIERLGQDVRILVSSSRMAWSESVSILSASEGIRVVASSAESGVRVPAACQSRGFSLHAGAGSIPSRAFSTVVSSGCVSNMALMACRLSSSL